MVLGGGRGGVCRDEGGGEDLPDGQGLLTGPGLGKGGGDQGSPGLEIELQELQLTPEERDRDGVCVSHEDVFCLGAPLH